MNRYIVLLRGINVGSKNRITMAELRDAISTLGYTDINTYIQSGNVVLSSQDNAPAATQNIKRVLRTTFAIDTSVRVLKSEALAKVISDNPFPEVVDPKTLHVFFLSDVIPRQGIDALDQVKSPTERCDVQAQIVYLHAPDGIGRSKLAGSFDKIAGSATTSRNWQTVIKLSELI